MTWADILAEARRGLKENSATPHWSEAELLRRANIAQRKIVRFTKCLVKTDSATTSTSGTRSYAVPSDLMMIKRVWYDGVRIFGMDIDELDMNYANSHSDWSTVTGTPTNYYETQETSGYISLVPLPDTTADVIKFEYVCNPTDLAASTSVPFNGITSLYDYHELIVSYVLWQCMLEDGNDLFREHKENYLSGLMQMRRNLLDKPDILQNAGLLNRRNSNFRPIPGW